MLATLLAAWERTDGGLVGSHVGLKTLGAPSTKCQALSKPAGSLALTTVLESNKVQLRMTWCARLESNQRPLASEASTLSTELRALGRGLMQACCATAKRVYQCTWCRRGFGAVGPGVPPIIEGFAGANWSQAAAP
jgi:hypothetical protein